MNHSRKSIKKHFLKLSNFSKLKQKLFHFSRYFLHRLLWSYQGVVLYDLDCKILFVRLFRISMIVCDIGNLWLIEFCVFLVLGVFGIDLLDGNWNWYCWLSEARWVTWTVGERIQQDSGWLHFKYRSATCLVFDAEWIVVLWREYITFFKLWLWNENIP